MSLSVSHDFKNPQMNLKRPQMFFWGWGGNRMFCQNQQNNIGFCDNSSTDLYVVLILKYTACEFNDFTSIGLVLNHTFLSDHCIRPQS